MQDSSSALSSTTKKRGRRRKVPKRLNEKPHPEYEYAINEYYQTVSPHEANDDGRNLYAYDHDEVIRSGESSQRRKTPTVETVPPQPPPVASMPTTKVATATSAGLEEIEQQIMQQVNINDGGAQQQQQQEENHENDSKLPASTTVPLQRGIMTPIQEQFTRSGTGSQSVSGDDTVKFAHYSNTYNAYQTPTGKSMIHNNEVQGEIPNSNNRGMTNVPLGGGGDGPIGAQQQQQDPYINTNYDNDLVASSSYISMPSPQDSMISSVFDIETPMHMLHQQYQQEATMADATYEEFYGDAYVGAPIKYIYPAGYQNMRPRSGPWKLAIFVCLLFTWLSIFIVGHCSDRAEGNNKNNYYNNNNAEMDDDTYVIEQRWCGSKMLYSLWVVSMLITGLACAYCSIIGYIFVRDFSVANLRSQPPGMVGKSDYYVTIGQQHQQNNNNNRPPSSPSTSSHNNNNNNNENNHYYRKTIYQADGTPQYWGEHIYRPTQAAVAITSR